MIKVTWESQFSNFGCEVGDLLLDPRSVTTPSPITYILQGSGDVLSQSVQDYACRGSSYAPSQGKGTL